MANILLVSSVNRGYPSLLEQIGHQVSCLTNGCDAISACYDDANVVDLIISDLDLPDIPATTMMDAIRIRWLNLPIIYLAKSLAFDTSRLGCSPHCMVVEQSCPFYLLSHWVSILLSQR